MDFIPLGNTYIVITLQYRGYRVSQFILLKVCNYYASVKASRGMKWSSLHLKCQPIPALSFQARTISIKLKQEYMLCMLHIKLYTSDTFLSVSAQSLV